MAKQSITNLLGRAGQVKSELLTGANSALRIGQLLLDILASGAFEYDPSRPYLPGEMIIWQGRIVRCFLPTQAGQSPETTPANWDDKVIDSITKLIPTGSDYPVLAKALQAYVTKAISDAKLGGGNGSGLTKANEQMITEGLDDSAYVTPYLVKLAFSAISKALENVTQISLNKALEGGADSGIMPFFLGGVSAVLPQVPLGLKVQTIVIAEDGTFYAGSAGVTPSDPDSLVYDFSKRVHFEAVPNVAGVTYDFSKRVHYEAVPAVVNQNTPPLLNNPAKDIEFTTFGVSLKSVPDDQFIDVGDTYTRTAVVLIGGLEGTRTALPPFLKFDGDAGTFTATLDATIDNYSFVVLIECTDSQGQKADPDIVLVSVNVPRTAANPQPTIVNRQSDVLITTAGDYTIELPQNEFADNAGDPGYTISKKFDRLTGGELPFLPAGVVPNESTRKIVVGGAVPNQTFSILRKYVDSANQSAFYAFDVIVNRPVAGVRIDRMAIFLPYGWHGVYFGNLSENIVLLVNVAGGSMNTPVFARYPQSRNDATFGVMQPLDYSKNNVPPNILPEGFTHYTMFNDETFSTGFKSFQAKINNIANSTVEASVQLNAIYPDFTFIQIYPQSN